MTLISVVMPVLNAAPYIGEAVDSILAQTHRELELILVDDGSSDGSAETVASYARADSRVRALYRQRDPSLTSGARAANEGIAIATGEWIARMDNDDIAFPERLAVQLDFVRAHGLEICGAAAIGFGAGEHEYHYPATHEAIERELVFRVGLLHPTMIATAEVMRRLPYDETTTHDDYEWQTRATASARFGNCPNVLLRRRLHPRQANVVGRPRFLVERRRYRFSHFYRLFPRTPAREYQIVNAMADGARLVDRAELETAGRWFHRLADLPDRDLRRRMAKRWLDTVRKADVPDSGDIELRYLRLIEGAA